MNTQIKIEQLDKSSMDNITSTFRNFGLDISQAYLKKNGRSADEWNDDISGLVLKLDGKKIFQAHKTSATIFFKNIPHKHHQDTLRFFKAINIAKAPEFGLGIGLSALFLILACFIIAFKAIPESINLAAFMIGSLVACILSIIILALTTPKSVDKDPAFIPSLILYFIGMVGFAPSSLLTLPLMRALIQKRSYQLFE
jgi:hypothetical protein